MVSRETETSGWLGGNCSKVVIRGEGREDSQGWHPASSSESPDPPIDKGEMKTGN